MSVSVTTSPEFPTTRKPARFTFSASSGQRVHLFLTDAPLKSAFKKRLTELGSQQLSLHEGDVATPYDFEADVSGVYTFSIQEIATPMFRGAFKGDTRGMLSIGSAVGTEKVLGVTAPVTVEFGDRLTMQIGAKPNAATLVLWTWGATIRPTTIELHGEASPAIVSPTSPVAETAITNPAVVSTLSSIPAGLSATVALGSVAAHVDSLIVNLAFHDASGSHFAPDTVNFVPAGFLTPGTKDSTVASIAKCVERLGLHMNSDASLAGVAFGIGSATTHQMGGFDLADNANTLVSGPPSDLETAIVALADCYLSYEAHRVSTVYHAVADTTNVLMTPSPLVALHILFLTVTKSVNPSASPGENAGATTLIHGAGMRSG